MKLPPNKTRLVCTIGPASDSVAVMRRLLQAGMNVARLNFSHGDFDWHARVIKNLRQAARSEGLRLAVMADLPGPKMRIGELRIEPVELKNGEPFVLTTEQITGGSDRVSVTFDKLPEKVAAGNRLFLNDGMIELEVTGVSGRDVACRIKVGGELRSRKGLNLPGIDLGISAFTDRDHDCLAFAMAQGVDAVSQSFVESAEDIEAVRSAAGRLGYRPFIIAKIERSRALANIDAIVDSADGLMVARGDLGVEIPIERIALIQKELIHRANMRGKPVITATQMLESMTASRRPTRAEATDVANAVLDGTDCVMLSAESAMGAYPVESADMLARIAAAAEPHLARRRVREDLQAGGSRDHIAPMDLIFLSVEATLRRSAPAAVFTPTRSGYTPRGISRFRLPVWIVAVSPLEATCQSLQFSWGVHPVQENSHPADWTAYIRAWVASHELAGELALLTEGPSDSSPDTNNRVEIIRLAAGQA